MDKKNKASKAHRHPDLISSRGVANLQKAAALLFWELMSLFQRDELRRRRRRELRKKPSAVTRAGNYDNQKGTNE